MMGQSEESWGWRALVVSCGLASVTGYLESGTDHCIDGRLCPSALVCDDAHHGCVLPEQLAECQGEAEFTSCSYPNQPDGACYDGVCLPAGCGNGFLDPDEVCEDGNSVSGDGCREDCES